MSFDNFETADFESFDLGARTVEKKIKCSLHLLPYIEMCTVETREDRGSSGITITNFTHGLAHEAVSGGISPSPPWGIFFQRTLLP